MYGIIHVFIYRSRHNIDLPNAYRRQRHRGIRDRPDAESALSALLVRYIEALVYQGIVENIACEQSSRMIAMHSATENAGDMINDLQLIYNKARQAAITQEISEIVAGAAAV